MSYFQVCARCGARTPVGAAPATWCPVCRGVLMSPVFDGNPPPAFLQHGRPVPHQPTRSRPLQQRPSMRVTRNFRWIAHAPTRTVRRTTTPRRTPTPRYTETPRWGLVDLPRTAAPEKPTVAVSIASMAPTLLIASAIAFVLAAVAELGRYWMLLVNRHELVRPITLGMSDAAELALSVLAMLLGLVTTVSCVLWLRGVRVEAYGEGASVEPRRMRTLILGTLVPVVNLVMPGVFLTEMATVAPRAGLDRAIRWWWIAWVINWALLAGVLLWRLQDDLQAIANGVVFTAFQDLVAAAVAVLTLLVIRRSEGRGIRGRAREVTRWTVAVDDDVDKVSVS